MHSWLIPALGIFTEMQSGNRLPHALLVTAAAGLGGTDLAMEMARRFLCSGDRSEGCSCHSCSMFRVGGHPDLTLISGSQSGTIGIDEIRQGISAMEKTATNDHGKALVIPEADKMTEAAANALLKTLEEPPPESLIILTTGNQRNLLPTILSRAMKIPVPVPGMQELQAFVKEKTGRDQDFRAEIFLSGHSPLKAAEYAENGTGAKVRQALEQLNGVLAGSCSVPDLADFLLSELESRDLICSFFYGILRDALMLETGSRHEDLVFLGAYPDLAARVSELDPDSVLEGIKRLNDLKMVKSNQFSFVRSLQIASWIELLTGKN
jgi:DNA polymerase-3 subunit delta'